MSPNRLSVTITSNRPGSVDEEDRRGVDVLVGDLDVGELRRRPPRRCATTGARRRSARCACAPGSGACAAGLGAARTRRAPRARRRSAVLTLTSVAISCGVPTRSAPPLPMYGPSVPSRTTTKSMRSATVDGQRAEHPGVEPGRAQVDVVVEREPQPQQQTALEHAAGHRRVADRAEQDRVVLLAARRAPSRAASRRCACQRAAPRSYSVVVTSAPGADHRVEHLEALGDDLRADTVAGDDGEVEGRRCGLGHGVQPRESVSGYGRPSQPVDGWDGRPCGRLTCRSAASSVV